MIPEVIVSKSTYNQIDVRFDPDVSLWHFPNENSNQFIRFVSNFLTTQFMHLPANQATLNAVKVETLRIMCSWINDKSIVIY